MDLSTFAPTPTSFPRRGRAITPSNTTDLPFPAKAVIVVVAGNVVVLPIENPDNEPITFTGCEMGFVVPYQVRRVLATGTTATVYTAES
ncbi:spike base protein, RCAP_Rcc01079 family [Ancylobacter vacuolatus]|uniref:Uncharacterized protein n=1 Tax=Ancylobacter vacuolatus TaxID=223389 RepID=A0ABU0DHE9_9HYPH|nr:hypothetical protein [Ancylobacter vacuolatus]MDQ0347856.1 hypothetical protein [Ancylobacter vacuolatus]